MLSPYPSTVRRVRLYANIVMLAAAFLVSAGIMLGLSIPMKWLLDYLMAVFEVTEPVQSVVSQIAIGYLVIFAVAILFAGFMDVVKLVTAIVWGPSDMRRDFDNDRE